MGQSYVDAFGGVIEGGGIKQSARITPIATRHARIEIELRRRDSTCRPASGGEGRGWIRAALKTCKKNKWLLSKPVAK